MSTYELDDDLVRLLVAGHWSPDTHVKLARALQPQLPVTTPTKLGAVVRTDKANFTWVRFQHGDLDDACWADADDGERRSTSNIGRITEVLFEGVEL